MNHGTDRRQPTVLVDIALKPGLDEFFNVKVHGRTASSASGRPCNLFSCAV